MEEETPKVDEMKSARKGLTPKEISESIRSAVKWQKKGPYEQDDARWEQWKRNKKYLMCIWPGSGDEDVNVNTIRSNFMTKRPTLYFHNPKISLVPTKPSFTRDISGEVVKNEKGHPILVDNYVAARIASVKVNYELREIKFKKLMKKVRDDVLCPYGIGWAKVGYSMLSVGGHDNDRDTHYTYWIQRVDPRNIVYDWMATDIDNVRMIHERLIMTRQEAEEYEFKIPEDYVCSLPDFLKERSKSSKKEESPDDLVIIWETEDTKNRRIYWTIGGEKEGASSYEAKPSVETPYPFEGSAYVPLVLNDDNDDIIGLSDVEPIEDQAKAINRIRTKQTKHIEWFGSKIIYKDGTIEPSEIDKTKATDHGVYIKRNTGSTSDDVRVEGTPSMGQDNYAMVNEHKEDIRTTLGITEFQQGSAGGPNTRATIGNIVQNASMNRIEEGRDIIKDFVTECVRKLFACIQQFSSDEDYVNLKDETLDEDFVGVLKEQYGYDPKIPFLRMSKKDIQGEFNFEFNVEDMIVQPKEVRSQQFTNFLTMVFSNPTITQKFVEEFDIAKTLKKGAELFGIDLGELRKGGPAMMSPEQENQMWGQGMEVPEPHAKDHDDEHIMSHERFKMEVQQKLSAGQAQQQQIQQQALMAAQSATDPMQVQQLQQQAEMQLQELQLQLMPLTDMLRKASLHVQGHAANRTRKESGSSGGAPQMPQGQPAATMQTNMQAQAGAQ